MTNCCLLDFEFVPTTFFNREIAMLKTKLVVVTAALTFGTLFTIGDAPDAMAQAKKKLTFEQAFAVCKKDVDANVAGTDATTTAARHTRGAACMKRHGYRLKKGTPI
jgi:hypothetical protein